ncbi:hypothetical protein N7508_006378 [Penicillium antarcticum]|uniref:uncharacterized protein n=1 Tax=Penicillium antarcticum TaxID=416450 RepID=UPI002388EDAD|nr:uncharacterized protein N7508_006378 [Penicillium antarcticum]KAJ5301515.1 hypothetical protein N7508_006378 [Penicillium antarcticum]
MTLLYYAFMKTKEQDACSSSLAFFSEKKINTLSELLGNDALRRLIEALESIIKTRLLVRSGSGSTISPVTFMKPSRVEEIPRDVAASYVDAYFQNLHSMYPFLNQRDFKERALGPNVQELLKANPAFAALYHTVLALGCQYHDGGTWEPGKGEAWKHFQVALGLIAEILLPREQLTGLQALVAMSIFAMNTCCLQIDEVLITEAARMAQGLRYHKAVWNEEGTYTATCRRTFWVIYNMEKHMCFHSQVNSIIADYDIGCPVPDIPEAIYGDFNWFLSAIRFSRILSQAYVSLFSVSATMKSQESYYSAIDQIQGRLESWRLAIPESFRPGLHPHFDTFSNSGTKMPAIYTHLRYYSLVIALARLTLYLSANETSPRTEENKRTLMMAARMVIELIQFVDTAPHTPIFILSIMPLVAMFILFDFVVHNPRHAETRDNLALLEVAAGHFSLQEYKSRGVMPSSLVGEFSHIARQYVRDIETRSHLQSTMSLRQATGAMAERVSDDATETGNNLNGQREGNLDHEYFAEWDGRNDFLCYPITPENMGHAPDDNPALGGYDLRTLFGSLIPEACFADGATGETFVSDPLFESRSFS